MTPQPHPPEVNVSKCVGCGLCVRVCPSFVLDVSNGKALMAKSDWCIGCGHCAAICPMEALHVEGISSEADSGAEVWLVWFATLFSGEVSERLKEHAWKVCMG